MSSRGWVVMLSGSPWHVAAHRQQALARRLTGEYHVLFVDPPGNRPQRDLRVARIVEHAPGALRRLRRLAAPEHAIPACGPLEKALLPGPTHVIAAALELWRS